MKSFDLSEKKNYMKSLLTTGLYNESFSVKYYIQNQYDFFYSRYIISM